MARANENSLSQLGLSQFVNPGGFIIWTFWKEEEYDNFMKHKIDDKVIANNEGLNDEGHSSDEDLSYLDDTKDDTVVYPAKFRTCYLKKCGCKKGKQKSSIFSFEFLFF